MKIYRIAQEVVMHDTPSKSSPTYDDDSYERATNYFSIGHGDFNEDAGMEPKFILWIFDGSRIQYRSVNELDEDSGSWNDDTSHRIEWGQSANRLYKGRYEPETGQLSIVKPERQMFRDVPSVVMKSLQSTFDNIKQIHIF